MNEFVKSWNFVKQTATQIWLLLLHVSQFFSSILEPLLVLVLVSTSALSLTIHHVWLLLNHVAEGDFLGHPLPQLIVYLISLVWKVLIHWVLAELVERIEVLILLLIRHGLEESWRLAVVNPIDLKELESSASHELVQLWEDLASSGLFEVLSYRSSLNNHPQQVKVISLLKHKFVSGSKLLCTDQFARPEIDLSWSGLSSKLVLQGGNLCL